MNPLLDPEARLVIAHRGDQTKFAENTVDALVHAVEIGSDAVEFDVRLTRDGVPVLMHDPTLDRTTSGHGLLSDYALSDVRTLDAGAPNSRTQARSTVPTLDEVLDCLRATPLVIEVKEAVAIEATALAVRKFGATARVLIGSGEIGVVERFRTLGFCTCASMTDALRLLPRAFLGGSAPVSRYSVLSITPRYAGVPIPVSRMAAAAKRAGIPTHVWTVNDPAVALRYWKGGVAGVLTDDPATLIAAKPG